MSHETQERALDQGHDCAMSAVSAQRAVLADLPPTERLNWWIGFISAAMRAALASVGEAATRILKDALAERSPVASRGMRRRRTYLRKKAS